VPNTRLYVYYRSLVGQIIDCHQSVLRARMEKMTSAGQDFTPNILSYSSPSSHSKESPPSIKSDPYETTPSLLSSNMVRCYTTTSMTPFFLTLSQPRALKKSESLSSLPKQSESKEIQYSSARDDAFYPSYLRRPPPVPKLLSPDSVDGFSAMSSVPISRSLIRHIPPELLDLDDKSARTAALWERAAWETTDQALLEMSPWPGSSTSPPEKILVSKWNEIIGGGQ
jgi:hypothetical protein